MLNAQDTGNMRFVAGTVVWPAGAEHIGVGDEHYRPLTS